jgi:probable F420-dependent oxidoreductase
MVNYLDRLDAGGVPPDRRILAALGPRALHLAAERTLGTHPYLVVPDHTRAARQMLGPGAVIAPEHKVVLDADPDRARATGRAFVSNPYLCAAGPRPGSASRYSQAAPPAGRQCGGQPTASNTATGSR